MTDALQPPPAAGRGTDPGAARVLVIGAVDRSEAAALRQRGATLRTPPSASAQLTRLAPGRPWPERLAAWMLHLVLDTMRQLSASMVRAPGQRRDPDDAPPP